MTPEKSASEMQTMLSAASPANLLELRDMVNAEIQKRIDDTEKLRTMLGGIKRRVRSDSGKKREGKVTA